MHELFNVFHSWLSNARPTEGRSHKYEHCWPQYDGISPCAFSTTGAGIPYMRATTFCRSPASPKKPMNKGWPDSRRVNPLQKKVSLPKGIMDKGKVRALSDHAPFPLERRSFPSGASYYVSPASALPVFLPVRPLGVRTRDRPRVSREERSTRATIAESSRAMTTECGAYLAVGNKNAAKQVFR
jgi:hypothetical protein